MPTEQPCFEYTQAELTALRRSDERLGAAMDKIGPIQRKVYPDACAGIIHAIIGQQVSAHAHTAIWQRFSAAFDPCNPEPITAAKTEDLARISGISRRKAGYIQAICEAFANGRLARARLEALADEEVRVLLTQFAGIGKWTVDMVLIFTLQRKNVLPFEDLAIRRGLERLYGYDRITPELFQIHFRNYAPNATLASLYLWEIAGAKNQNWLTGVENG